MTRPAGFYWVRRKPTTGSLGPFTSDPEVAQWDPEWPCWWFIQSDIPKDDCEVDVLSPRLELECPVCAARESVEDALNRV